MKVTLTHSATLLVLLALSWSADRACGAQAKARTTASSTVTNAVRTAAPAEIPKSVFVVSANPRELRNPFFPSVYTPPTPSPQPTPSGAKPAPQVDTTRFVLNGITPNGPKRTAMINSHTFEAGETGEVKLANGEKVLIKCEEIRSESVVIVADGQRRELKFRYGL